MEINEILNDNKSISTNANKVQVVVDRSVVEMSFERWSKVYHFCHPLSENLETKT